MYSTVHPLLAQVLLLRCVEALYIALRLDRYLQAYTHIKTTLTGPYLRRTVYTNNIAVISYVAEVMSSSAS